MIVPNLMLANGDDIGFIVSMVCTFAFPVALVLFGLTLGAYFEKRHLRQIKRRKGALAHVPLSDTQAMPQVDPTVQVSLVTAEAVYSAGYLKGLLAALKKIFGGELRSYRLLMFRTREEAILRLTEQAVSLGYDGICNLRIDTADIANAVYRQNNPATYVCIVASGTAYKRAR
ncbi:MAG: heavy metal-binding domain-containing protein [Planctomycetota bacterium]